MPKSRTDIFQPNSMAERDRTKEELNEMVTEPLTRRTVYKNTNSERDLERSGYVVILTPATTVSLTTDEGVSFKLLNVQQKTMIDEGSMSLVVIETLAVLSTKYRGNGFKYLYINQATSSVAAAWMGDRLAILSACPGGSSEVTFKPLVSNLGLIVYENQAVVLLPLPFNKRGLLPTSGHRISSHIRPPQDGESGTETTH
ncbi:hypothetical protein J6590_060276 [Homalodisca vitripennis]|nr:hypothetical protein J6590_060276 [Homalodisca vitripennis]